MMETKQVIVVRKDLNMRKGKLAAQVAHASMKVILNQAIVNILKTKYTIHLMNGSALYDWLNNLFTKVVVSCNSEEELLELHKKAKEENILCCLIQDSGKTEFHGVPTYTTLAIGPDYSENIDKITGHLSLL